MDLKTDAVDFLTQLLNCAANDNSISNEGYLWIRAFILKTINDLRRKNLKDLSEEIRCRS